MDVMGKDNLYVEIQNHGLDLEQQAMPPLIKIAEEFGLPLVGTNDSHYLSKGDHNSHDILLCVQTGKSVNDQQRLAFENQFYLKTIDEMHQVFKDYPAEVITNTVDIATRCQLNLSYGQNIMPEYKVPEGHTADSYLKGVCFQGLNDFAKSESPNGIEDRLNYELSVIEQTGYAGYFLIVWDYVNYARNQGFPLNARGLAATSLNCGASSNASSIVIPGIEGICLASRSTSPKGISNTRPTSLIACLAPKVLKVAT
jgi:DNA polymerase-3 subunit alpha